MNLGMLDFQRSNSKSERAGQISSYYLLTTLKKQHKVCRQEGRAYSSHPDLCQGANYRKVKYSQRNHQANGPRQLLAYKFRYKRLQVR